MKSENGNIQLLLLNILPLFLGASWFGFQQSSQIRQRLRVEKLCYIDSLKAQSKLANALNWVEKSYNPRARKLNRSWEENKKLLEASPNPKLKAILLARKLYIETQQGALRFQLEKKWSFSLKERSFIFKKLLSQLQEFSLQVLSHKVHPLSLVAKNNKYLSPEYYLPMTRLSLATKKIQLSIAKDPWFQKFSLLKVNSKKRYSVSCDSKIVKWKSYWIAQLFHSSLPRTSYL